MNPHCATRRRLLTTGLAIPALAIPAIGYSASRTSRRLSFYHTHTREALDVVYREDDDYLPDGLEQINRFLRDFRTRETHAIDPQLLDQLSDLQAAIGSTGRFQIISGYRSPQTNALLRDKTRGVAKRSLHMRGRAIDIRLTDVRTKTVREAALSMQRGGVGYYPKSDFVHLDTGRFRTW